MNRRGFFAALLAAPFAATSLLSKPSAHHGRKWRWIYGAKPYWPKNITRQAFLEALKAEERVKRVTGSGFSRQLIVNEIEKTILVRNSLYDPT